MAVEIVIALLLLTALLAGAAGFALARRGAPARSDLDALRADLDAAERRAEAVQANVTGHFEQSAVLFGQLARDYRAFLEHFSESAQELGISEVKARELLARADQPLLGQGEAVIDGKTSTPAPDHLSEPASRDAAASVEEPEPPLIEDVVEPGEKRARVVDVEVDALGLPLEDQDRQTSARSRRG